MNKNAKVRKVRYAVPSFESLKTIFFFGWSLNPDVLLEKENQQFIVDAFNALPHDEKKKAIVWMFSKLSAKMDGIPAISTNSKLNTLCNKLCMNVNNVCNKCYARKGINKYHALERKLTFNHIILTHCKLCADDIPVDWIYRQSKHGLGRFQSHGELNNEIELNNYMTIAEAVSGIHWSLYTKNIVLLKKYREKHVTPNNVSFGYSIAKVNPSEKYINYCVNYYGYNLHVIDFVFAVYTGKYAKENNIVINCGAKHCGTCSKCYLCAVQYQKRFPDRYTVFIAREKLK